MPTTFVKSWKLKEDADSSVLLVEIKEDLATLSVRNSLDVPKPLFIAVHTFRLDSQRGIKGLLEVAGEWLDGWRTVQVRKFLEDHGFTMN
jgi:hypothetical protein